MNTENLKEATASLHKLAEGIKTNFIQIGKLLLEIREKRLYKEKYNNFLDYIESENFEFGKSHAYRFMQIAEKFGNFPRVGKINFRTLIQLTYIPDKEKREEMLDEAKEIYQKKDPEKFKSQVDRFVQRISEVTNKKDSHRDKTIRLFKEIYKKIDEYDKVKLGITKSIEKALKMSIRYHHDYTIQRHRMNVLGRWRP